ncbi:MAG: phosphoribosylamine--glycine ligase [Cyclobacteriaceae bacterium]|jgi:phosphoribosylamine--glycine ligase
MNVLVLGSGGREHALAWKIRQSSLCEKVFVAPGNGGTHKVAENIPVDIKDFDAIKSMLLDKEVTMLIVGPEEPLVLGIVDELKADSRFQDLYIIGPDKLGATLEGSKQFAKEFMLKNNIPTAGAKYINKDNLELGFSFLEELDAPYVLKADGLAAGKGVIITDNLDEAKENLKDLILNQRFGKASATVLIEEFLSGIELSVFVLIDGKGGYVILPEAKDYKNIGEGNTGLNTGGMGAVSPVIFADRTFMQKVEDRIVKPTVAGIQAAEMDYKGFVFIGLMNKGGEPFVIEYNVRMGDPETEAVMPRIKSDFLETLIMAAKGELENAALEIEPFTCATVMTVSGGYPEAYEKDKLIAFKEELKEVVVFHAGTKMIGKDVYTNGGRVITVTALGKNMEEATSKSYKAIQNISFEGVYYRKDIGFDLQELGQ